MSGRQIRRTCSTQKLHHNLVTPIIDNQIRLLCLFSTGFGHRNAGAQSALAGRKRWFAKALTNFRAIGRKAVRAPIHRVIHSLEPAHFGLPPKHLQLR